MIMNSTLLFRGALIFSARCKQSAIRLRSLVGEMCAGVKGLVKVLGHSGLCWLARVEHAGVEINYLECGGTQL